MEIFVTGATGAIGRPLVGALMAAGHDVMAASRTSPSEPGPVPHVTFDLDGPIGGDARETLDRADAAYYLVHALGDPGFAGLDRHRAERFAALWGPERRVVYLGGLGQPGQGSPHLRSRHEVGDILRVRTNAVELRAALVIGADSLSFQLLSRLGHLAGRSPLPLPFPAPTASTARTQPIGEADLLRSLIHALDVPAGSYDIGGPEVIRYADLMERSARVQGLRLGICPSVPMPPELIGPLAALLADVDPWATAALFAGMGDETVARRTHRLPGPDLATTPLDDAIRAALTAAGTPAP